MNLPDNPTLQFLILHGYWIAVPVMIVEGPIATLVMAFFASFGYFNPFIVFFLGVVSDLVSDSAYYAIGYWGGEKFIRSRLGRFFKLTENSIRIVKDFYAKNGGKTVFLAKVLTGIAVPVFGVAGLTRMKLRRFYLFAIPGGVIWSAGLVALGYYFGRAFEGDFTHVEGLIGGTGIVMISLLTLFIVYKYYLSRLIREKIRLVNGFINKEPDEKNDEEKFPS